MTVGEIAGTGTSLANYVSSVSCDSDKGGSSTTSHSFTANFGDKVTCTITNQRKPEVKVIKALEPTSDSGKFNLLINGNVELANAGNGGDTGYKQVAVGGVTVGESAGTGTSLGNYDSKVDCGSKGSVNPGTGHAFSVAYGDRVVCTITNTRKATLTVIKHVINDNGGGKNAGNFAISVTGSNPSPASFNGAESPGTSVAIGPGAYNVTETEDPGYAASYSAGCSGTLPAGGSATCTITNDDKAATLTVIKHVVNDNGGSAVAGAFTMTINGVTASGGNSFAGAEAPGVAKTLTSVGQYSVSESSVSGYTQTIASADCSGTIALGESKTCTITNDDQAGTLTVIKHVVNDDGGGAQASSWTMNVAGPTALSFPGAESPGTSNPVSAGAYKITESGGGAGYTLSYSGDCDADGDVVVALGQSRTCTLTNDDQPATLTVVKHVVNDNGGSATAGAFSMTINGVTAAGGNSFGGAEAPGVTKSITSFGAYTVTESTVAGYEQTSASADCAGTIALGQHKTCTITNNDKAATLTVIKHVVNDNGGSAVAGAFTMTINGVTASGGNSFAGAEAPGVAKTLTSVGQYSVSESSVSGYTQTIASADCSGTIALGESKTCTITNDDQAGTLTVIKHVVNDDGGGAQASSWTMNVAGPTALSFPGAESPGTSNPVSAGAYKITESGGGAGYTLSYSGDCDADGDVVVALGQSRTCTLTNDDEAARLIVKKVVVNDNGGTKLASEFSFQVNGGQAQPFEADGQNELTVPAGTYTVTEPSVPGYGTSYANCAQLVIPNGGSATCTVTNDDLPATLIVKKVVVNDNGGTKRSQDFSFSVNGGQAQSFEADGQNDLEVAAGTYDVTEPAVAGYTTTYQGCADIELPLGGTATCIVTNNDVPRGQGSIDVQKSANPTTVKEPGGPVTFSVTITNTSVDVDVAIQNVVDDKFGDLDDDGGNGCFDVPINLAPGEKVNCTFSKTITGVGGTSHVNTVTASGTDENGNKVSDSDDARVDITERLIDLVVVKEASSPTPLNGIVDYSLTVTNKGPDTATNVQLADPAPAGITYLTANPSQGTCNLSPALITCSLGTIAAGQTVTIAITGRATTVGSHTNTATVTGGGGRETNPADNVDTAVTVVPAPLKPPVAKPQPEPAVCLSLTVSPKMITADGKPDKVTAKVTAAGKRVKGAKVSVKGAGVSKTARFWPGDGHRWRPRPCRRRVC